MAIGDIRDVTPETYSTITGQRVEPSSDQSEEGGPKTTTTETAQTKFRPSTGVSLWDDPERYGGRPHSARWDPTQHRLPGYYAQDPFTQRTTTSETISPDKKQRSVSRTTSPCSMVIKKVDQLGGAI